MQKATEKRTKEQMMRLLDRAIEQEEVLLERLQTLESELADCRKKAKNPRHELEELALPASKVSFRLDYYRTEDNVPFKGIIEHLPTRESLSFEADCFDEIRGFVANFVGIIPPTLLPPQPRESTPRPKVKSAEPTPAVVLTAERAVNRGQDLKVSISMQELGAFRGKPCALNILVESREKQPLHRFEVLEYCTPVGDMLEVAIPAVSLEQGVYRLVVSMTLRDKPQTAYFKESRLLIVR